ncbi:MAG: CGNR zinc finger domain-containing protein [Microthrixaceae bacterium]
MTAAAEFPVLGQALSIELANTLWVHGGREIDALATTGGAQRWVDAMTPRLAEVGWVDDEPPRVDDALRERLVTLRGCVRELFGAVAAHTAPASDVLAHLATASRVAPRWLEGEATLGGALVLRVHWKGADSGRALLAALADDAILLAAGTDAELLRACPGPGCVGFFSRDSARRKFCSPTCSTRWRVARHYAKQRADAPKGAPH